MKHLTKILILVIMTVEIGVLAEQSVRIQDIAHIDGMKRNQVYGYGLVVGLQGTGDSQSPLTNTSLQNLLKNLGLEGEAIKSKNTAAVLLTAVLNSGARVGDHVDVTVSSIGDAKSLNGGILVQSPLKGADSLVYVVAQGRLGQITKTANKRSLKTVGVVSDGGIVERDIPMDVVKDNSITIVLSDWDYSIIDQVTKVIAQLYPQSSPLFSGNGKIQLKIPDKVSLSEFISSIMEKEIKLKDRAVVVINERDGTVVAGGAIKISESMVSKSGLVVEIDNSNVKGSAAYLGNYATVKELVDSLNTIGASTTDIISIMKALKDSGALHAELIIK